MITPEILYPALRQYRHNTDNSPGLCNPKDGFVVGFDYEEILKVFTPLLDQNTLLKKALTEIDGCFEAALVEGWIEALADGDIDRIRDIYNRRIDYVRGIALRAAGI